MLNDHKKSIETKLFLTGQGFLYTFGEGDNGKLGIPGDITSHNTPQKLDIDSQFSTVNCGGSHTLALTGKSFNFPAK